MNHAAFERGLALFNQGRFFDAHEAWEDVWQPEQGRRRRFLQALIQVAAGLHHHSRGNLAGARSLLARGGNALAKYPPRYAGVEVGALRASLEAWRSALAEDGAPPSPPRLRLASTRTPGPRRRE